MISINNVLIVNQTTYTDKELLTRIAVGDEHAFNVFFERYSKLVHRFILKYNDDLALADDIIQEIFTKIWLTRESLPEITHVSNYLFTVAKNYAANLVRQKIREKHRHVQWHALQANDQDNTDLEPLLSLLDKAIAQLPERQQRTWVLSRVAGKKYVEIAEELGVSRETVKTNLQLAQANITRYVLANIKLGLALSLLKIL